MSYPVPSFESIKSNILRDIQNQNPDAYTGTDGDYAMRAAASAAALEGVYAHQQWVCDQIFPDRMDFDRLILYAADHGVIRRLATQTTCTLSFSGTPGAPVPISTQGVINGVAFQTTAAGVLGVGGTAAISASAVLPGVIGNVPVGSTLQLSSAPAGVSVTATISASDLNGSDAETQPQLLARVLFRLQNPPQGGSEADYYIWATNVPGCGFAYIFGQRTYANSVDIVILDSNGNLTTSALIAQVQASINAVRPVTATNCIVSTPTAVLTPITATVSYNGVWADIQNAVITSIQAYFSQLTPGQSVVFNELVMLVMSVTGVTDVAFTTPTANVAIAVNLTGIQLARLGAITINPVS